MYKSGKRLISTFTSIPQLSRTRNVERSDYARIGQEDVLTMLLASPWSLQLLKSQLQCLRDWAQLLLLKHQSLSRVVKKRSLLLFVETLQSSKTVSHLKKKKFLLSSHLTILLKLQKLRSLKTINLQERSLSSLLAGPQSWFKVVSVCFSLNPGLIKQIWSNNQICRRKQLQWPNHQLPRVGSTLLLL